MGHLAFSSIVNPKNSSQCSHRKEKKENHDFKVKFEVIGKNDPKNGDK